MKCNAEGCVRGFTRVLYASDGVFVRCKVCHGTGEVPDKPKEPEINLPDGYELWKETTKNNVEEDSMFFREIFGVLWSFDEVFKCNRFAGFVFYHKETGKHTWMSSGQRCVWVNKDGSFSNYHYDGYTLATLLGAVMRKEGKE